MNWVLIMLLYTADPAEHGVERREEWHASWLGCDFALQELGLARGQVVNAWCEEENAAPPRGGEMQRRWVRAVEVRP